VDTSADGITLGRKYRPTIVRSSEYFPLESARHFRLGFHRGAALIYDQLAGLLFDTINGCFHFSSGHTSQPQNVDQILFRFRLHRRREEFYPENRIS
jgi:hypothetical protein